jgi:hypothetical protein
MCTNQNQSSFNLHERLSLKKKYVFSFSTHFSNIIVGPHFGLVSTHATHPDKYLYTHVRALYRRGKRFCAPAGLLLQVSKRSFRAHDAFARYIISLRPSVILATRGDVSCADTKPDSERFGRCVNQHCAPQTLSTHGIVYGPPCSALSINARYECVSDPVLCVRCDHCVAHIMHCETVGYDGPASQWNRTVTFECEEPLCSITGFRFIRRIKRAFTDGKYARFFCRAINPVGHYLRCTYVRRTGYTRLHADHTTRRPIYLPLRNHVCTASKTVRAHISSAIIDGKR